MTGPLDIEEIKRILPHRYPFLLVDRILELDTDKKTVTGIKNVTFNEPFFQGHFPTDPIMPGVLVVETMGQVAGVMACLANPAYDPAYPPYFVGLDKVRFRHPVRPGDTLLIKGWATRSVGKVWRMNCEAFVEDKLVASAQLVAVINSPPEEGE